MFKDYYSILEINSDASAEEVKLAYRNMCKKWHPDKNPGRDVTSIMQDINEAYAILKDGIKRVKYDQEYRLYQSYKLQKQTSYQDSRTSNNFDSEYNVHDESLKQDINEARQRATAIVKDLLKSIKRETKNAGEAAIKEVIPYLIISIIGSIIMLLVFAAY